MQELELELDSGQPLNSSDVHGRELPLLLITLLKGVIYSDAHSVLWNLLVKMQAPVRDYVRVLGLQLILDESEGYAFLQSNSDEEQEENKNLQLPRLMARRPLPFYVSLLLALLRKKLAEFDALAGGTRLILTRDEIVNLLTLFIPASTNEVKIANKIDAHINKIVELGFLRRLKVQSAREDSFEVQRILKAFVDAQWLAEFDARLAAYRDQYINEIGDSQND